MALVLPLAQLDRSMLAVAGGKAVNLGELLQIGLPVPPGVCVSTEAYARAAEAPGIAGLVERVADAEADEQVRLASELRAAFEAVDLTDELRQAIATAVAELGEATPLAVRSSATAEDLPFASFAGQQETFLNVVGVAATLEAVRRCWASLWTERAVAYRSNNRIEQRSVALAVVIERLVDAAAAGVLFTADPLTGRRTHSVVEAHPGLGEAVVSGSVNPDHWLLESATAGVLEGPADGCLSPAQLTELVRLGGQVQAHFGSPQDIEFAFDRAGKAWLVQSRAITTLYPLPTSAPSDERQLRVYLSFNVAQGVFRPFTPMGVDAFRVLSMSLASAFGARPTKSIFDEAGLRLFLDITTPLRSPFWRPILRFGMSQGEARSGPLIDNMLGDPRLALERRSRRAIMLPILRAVWRSRVPLFALRAWIVPAAARRSVAELRRALAAVPDPPPEAGPLARVDAAEQLLHQWPRRILPRVGALLIAGLGSFGIAARLLGELASADDLDAVRRALPYNPTTEMDLALWQLAHVARADAASAEALRSRSSDELAQQFHAGSLPGVLQRGLAEFLGSYGHRAVAEIDVGVVRWSEDPRPLLAHLVNYLQVDAEAPSPETQFRTAAVEADRMVRELARRASVRRGRLRGWLVGFLLRRGRGLAGFREMPKFAIVLLLARARSLLLGVGDELVAAGVVAQRDDVFFLTFDEVRQALGGASVRGLVDERRPHYEDELRRRHVPRLLLSDGSEPRLPDADGALDGDVLRGSPASAGQVRGRARVILDPAGARLQPGEILVAPSTDPGWTPLFMTAGGLVMEMGGAMSHGAVVAREYGIPAVVGVADATLRISDGEQIAVDGSSGTVSRLG